MSTSYYDEDLPSGAALPLILRKKLQETQLLAKEPDETGSSDNGPETKKSFSFEPPPSALANAVFTATELEERLLRTTAAMIDIQKQLTRGEESYFEDTNAHGNLYRGWDMFIDAKDPASAPSSGGTGGSRRMHSDHRWFSGSCRSVTTRGVRQTSFYSSKSSTVSSSAQSRTTTPVPVEQKVNAVQQQQQQQPPPLPPQATAATTNVNTPKSENEAASINKAKESTTEVKDEKTNQDNKKASAAAKTTTAHDKNASSTTVTTTTIITAKTQTKSKSKTDSSDEIKVEKISTTKDKSKSGKADDTTPPSSNKKADKTDQTTKSTNSKKREVPTTPKADSSVSDTPNPPIRLSTRKKQKSDTLTFSKFP